MMRHAVPQVRYVGCWYVFDCYYMVIRWVINVFVYCDKDYIRCYWQGNVCENNRNSVCHFLL